MSLTGLLTARAFSTVWELVCFVKLTGQPIRLIVALSYTFNKIKGSRTNLRRGLLLEVHRL